MKASSGFDDGFDCDSTEVHNVAFVATVVEEANT